MESIDPSVERRRREYVDSGVPLSSHSIQSSSGLNTLSDFFKLMAENTVSGPYQQEDIHLNGKHLGSGAQFDVYGQQHVTSYDFPWFDQPFVATGPNPSSKSRNRPVVVAIKCPRFKLGFGNYDPDSASSMGFGTPSQLRSLELEIRALCDNSVRTHRNIVKLLAWGLQQDNVRERKVQPLSPFLVLEHGNCSLHDFLAKDDGMVPWQVLQQLVLDVSQGLSVLHASGIIHGDLKTDNVLIFPDRQGPFFCVAKLSDFGLSVLEQGKVFDIGTPGWQAPELPSDEGISTVMLVKCDYFSLGLVIFSTMLRQITPPLRAPNGKFSSDFRLMRSNLARSNIPRVACEHISSVLECLLQLDPSDRASDLKGVCQLLSHVDENQFDSQGVWINDRFNDDTPWGDLLRSMFGTTMILGSYSKYFKWMTRGISNSDMVSHSWQEIHTFLCEVPPDEYDLIAGYYLTNIELVINQRVLDLNQLMDVVGQEVTGHQLLGLCFNDRLLVVQDRSENTNTTRVGRRLRGSCAAIAAAKGYFPAQAVALKLLEDTSSKVLELVRSNDVKWQWNAVSTGYCLAWKFAHEHPKEHASALEHFRKSGGYNSHYICQLPKETLTYRASGIIYSPLDWLTAYPLHRAAVHGDVLELKRLLETHVHPIDSVDGTGETALQRACMAGAYNSVCALIERGADQTIKSKRLGTVPLHWLFVFEPKVIHDTAALLTSRNRSVLYELSAPGIEAFHYPFSWPVGTPLAWAVLSNRLEAVNILLELGPTLDSITDFFPSPPDWTKAIYGVGSRVRLHEREVSQDDPDRILWSAWIYYSVEQYRLPKIQSCISYQRQLGSMQSRTTRWGRQRNLHIFNTYGKGLNTAVTENDYDAVKQLVDMGADVNYPIKSVSGMISTALMTAIGQRNLDIVRLLLDNGARFDGHGFSGVHNEEKTPLLFATGRNHLGIVKILLERGAEVNEPCPRSHHGQITPLFEAAVLGRTEIAKLLLQYGAGPLVETEGYGNVLEAAVFNNNSELVDLFLERGVDPNTPGKFNTDGSALQMASYHGRTKILSALLGKGGNPNIREGRFETAIQAAINPSLHRMWRQQTAVVKMLLERGADVTINGGKYGSTMQAAACSGDDALAKLLLDAGALIDVGGGLHGSALQAAVTWAEDLKLLQLLLDHGADPDFGGDDEWSSPLQVAVHNGNEKQTDLLLSRGADPNIPGGLHGSALKTAEVSRNTTIAQMLLDWGARDESELDRWNSMLGCVSRSDISSVQFLLAKRFEQPKEYLPATGALSPLELANKVIDYAEYWSAELSQRHEKMEVSKDMEDIPYLQTKVTTQPSLNTKVCRVVFRIKSRDTELIKMPKLHRDNPHHNSHTWFEVGVSSKDSHQSRLVIQKNFCGSLVERTHNITWDFDNNDPRIKRFLGSLKPGDTLDVYAKSEAEQISYVDSIEVIVFYGHRPPPRSPIIEIYQKEPEITLKQAEPLPPTAEDLETPEKVPDRIQTTEAMSDESLTPKESKRAGFFRKIVSFFTCCFK